VDAKPWLMLIVFFAICLGAGGLVSAAAQTTGHALNAHLWPSLDRALRADGNLGLADLA
jgi:hypothetical protein